VKVGAKGRLVTEDGAKAGGDAGPGAGVGRDVARSAWGQLTLGATHGG